jgi:hypothetical protein
VHPEFFVPPGESVKMRNWVIFVSLLSPKGDDLRRISKGFSTTDPHQIWVIKNHLKKMETWNTD